VQKSSHFLEGRHALRARPEQSNRDGDLDLGIIVARPHRCAHFVVLEEELITEQVKIQRREKEILPNDARCCLLPEGLYATSKTIGFFPLKLHSPIGN
jgi:hypothetical protein